MRDVKKRCFLEPPPTDADLASLEPKPHDPISTQSQHELGVKMIYITGNDAEPVNKSCRLRYSAAGTGETPSASPDDLRKSFFTKRKKDVIGVEFGGSGKTAYCAALIESDGKKDP
ncbi:MAG: hypothetical protein LBB61_05765 [Treponema sp.]|jgi:hypothetical protein|nr:hypothetical protein [Treponema sp.]